jgi:DNA-binding response OmpR family regulator
MNKKKIMIAEDDTGIIEAMQIMLEDAGYVVTTTIDGQTVREMEKELPDVLLLDIWMSGTSGRDICKQLKTQDLTKHIPIIMCSANRDTEQIAREAGADDFLAKPFEMKDLLAKVKKHIDTPN